MTWVRSRTETLPGIATMWIEVLRGGYEYKFYLDYAVAAKTMRECRVIVTRQAFERCGSQPYAKRPDYDRTLELNLTTTVTCAG